MHHFLLAGCFEISCMSGSGAAKFFQRLDTTFPFICKFLSGSLLQDFTILNEVLTRGDGKVILVDQCRNAKDNNP